jgi:hypothetical protein
MNDATLKDAAGTPIFSFGDGQDAYDSNLHCVWTLKVANQYNALRLHFFQMQIRQGDSLVRSTVIVLFFVFRFSFKVCDSVLRSFHTTKE